MEPEKNNLPKKLAPEHGLKKYVKLKHYLVSFKSIIRVSNREEIVHGFFSSPFFVKLEFNLKLFLALM